ncbi:MAG: hypothetical protein HY864_17470 [Chloroflexi bacterium]|nr:hypothetical protein [Chloroflexota bacterium]
MHTMDIKLELQKEFEKAQQARIAKNEGQARVCARRAAGIAIREYFARSGTKVPSMSAVDLLNLLKEEAHLPADLKLIADHLTVRVTEEFTLPIDADLIAEARVLCNELIKKIDPEGLENL